MTCPLPEGLRGGSSNDSFPVEHQRVTQRRAAFSTLCVTSARNKGEGGRTASPCGWLYAYIAGWEQAGELYSERISHIAGVVEGMAETRHFRKRSE